MGVWLYIVLGVLLGVLLTPVVLWIGFKLFLRFYFGNLLKQLGEGAAGVPPFRLEVEPIDDAEWINGPTMDRVTRALEEHGFEHAGDYLLASSPPVNTRGFASPRRSLYALVYDWPKDLIPGLTLAVDVVAGSAHTRGEESQAFTVSNSPDTRLDRPPWATKAFLDVDIENSSIAVQALLDRMEEITSMCELEAVATERFVDALKASYAREMDWQIDRGGPQRDEIVRNLIAMQGIEEEDDCIDEVVEATQSGWREAIDFFVSEETRGRFVRHVTKMSAGEWEDRRGRIYIVHDRSAPENVIDSLVDAGVEPWSADDEDGAYDARCDGLGSQLKPHFEGRSVREAFASAQSELPEGRRFERLARVKSPWPADVYLSPESDD